jgi:uncharacterized membrane protein YozB (DUF420 family)
VSITDLPAVNASLNATSAILLVTGYVLIRRGQRSLHKRCMLGALAASTLFLTCYVTYHAQVGSRPFPGTGIPRAVYLSILVTHVILAATILPLALVTTFRALRDQLDRHVRVARWTFPVWVYVSVTGVVIDLMLYQMY